MEDDVQELEEPEGWPLFEDAVSKGVVTKDAIDEASGLAASRRNPGIFWTHNDSGNMPVIFALDETGAFKAEFSLLNVPNRDWEDIAVGPGPVDNIHYIYIGEIGDNDAVHKANYIYRFPEPDLAASGELGAYEIAQYDVITYVYPDGQRDAETLMVDPKTRDIYIVSKRESNVHLYKAAYPQATDGVITLEKMATLPYSFIVAGDIDASGDEILMKGYTDVYFWKRKGSETIAATLSGTPQKIKYLIEPQGEAIAWDAEGVDFYTLSEKRENLDPHLYFYKRK